jgi:hypothetical protein
MLGIYLLVDQVLYRKRQDYWLLLLQAIIVVFNIEDHLLGYWRKLEFRTESFY